jgi:hypothetical protein
MRGPTLWDVVKQACLIANIQFGMTQQYVQQLGPNGVKFSVTVTEATTVKKLRVLIRHHREQILSPYVYRKGAVIICADNDIGSSIDEEEQILDDGEVKWSLLYFEEPPLDAPLAKTVCAKAGTALSTQLNATNAISHIGTPLPPTGYIPHLAARSIQEDVQRVAETRPNVADQYVRLRALTCMNYNQIHQSGEAVTMSNLRTVLDGIVDAVPRHIPAVTTHADVNTLARSTTISSGRLTIRKCVLCMAVR